VTHAIAPQDKPFELVFFLVGLNVGCTDWFNVGDFEGVTMMGSK